jgi:TRAP-type mannitol/chloroaromatic compound transport system permease large subunit
VLTVFYLGFVLLVTLVKPVLPPAMPTEAREPARRRPVRQGNGHHAAAADPDLPGAGHHLPGIATPTEGGAMGAAGALALALAKRNG